MYYLFLSHCFLFVFLSPGGFDDWEVELSEGFLPRETEDPRQHGTGNETSGVSKATLLQPNFKFLVLKFFARMQFL